MALGENGGGLVPTMPVSPAYGGGGFGGFGGDWGWIILLLLFAGGGWGSGFGGGYGNMMLGMDFPWLLNGQNGINNNVSGGFRDAMLNDGITSIRDGLSSLSAQLCNSFAGVEQSANARQMADMNQNFAMQTSMNQGFNSIQGQLSQCCCDNRLATCQTQNIVQSEGAATRLAIQNQTQQIIDKMCQQEIDALKAQNLELQNRVNMQSMEARLVSQTAALVADNTAQTQYIVNRVAPYPIPAYTVANPVTPATA
jgi:hypothetical protein